MTPTTIDAVYRDGALHPASPLPLPDGTAVRVTITAPMIDGPPAARSAYEIIAAIVARSAKPGPEETSSTDHDRILYGQRGDVGDVR